MNRLIYLWRRFYVLHIAPLRQDKYTRLARESALWCGGFRG